MGEERFREILKCNGFNRIALAVAALWFLGLYPALNLFLPSWLPGSLRPTQCDFGQYYAGAFVAKNGLWEALYPIPRPEVYNQPPQFRPRFDTPLFHKEKLGRSKVYYPSIANPAASDFRPQLLERCPELQENLSFRYMYPPPLALLLRPLAWMDYETARQHGWPILSMAALFGLALFSARIHRLLAGREAYAQGLIMAAVTIFSFRGRTGIVDGNVTPILGFLIAFAAYAWMKQWQAGAGVAMIPLLLFKSITLTWCPLLLLGAVRWKTLLTLAVLTLGLNGAMLQIAGTAIYREYFVEVLPRLAKPVGSGIVAVVFRDFGVFPSGFYFGLQLVLCLLLYFGYWKHLRAPNAGNHGAAIAATLAGTLAVFCTFNFAVWDHYFPNYLFFPFLGWLAWEAAQARGRWRGVMGIAILAGFGFCAFHWAARGGIFYLLGPAALDFSDNAISTPFYNFCCPVFFLSVAFRRLFFLQNETRGAQPGQRVRHHS